MAIVIGIKKTERVIIETEKGERIQLVLSHKNKKSVALLTLLNNKFYKVYRIKEYIPEENCSCGVSKVNQKNLSYLPDGFTVSEYEITCANCGKIREYYINGEIREESEQITEGEEYDDT